MRNTNPQTLVATHSGNSDDGEFEHGLAAPILLQYWQIVFRWKWLIVGITVAFLALGLVVTLLMTPQFNAT